jgi:hypothetical protein
MRLQKAILTALICLFGMVLSGCYETVEVGVTGKGFYRTNRITGQVVRCSFYNDSENGNSRLMCGEMVGNIQSFQQGQKNLEANQQQ